MKIKFLTMINGGLNLAALAPGTNLGIDNLVAVASDSWNVANRVGNALKDGVQFTDALVIFQEFPVIQGIAAHAKTAFQELRNLNPEEAAEFARRVSENTGLPNDNSLKGKVKQALALVARTYRVVDDAVVVGHDWVNLVQAGADDPVPAKAA